MTVYVALRSLGIKVDVRPVILDNEEDEVEEEETESLGGVMTEEAEKERAERKATKEAEKREAEKSPEKSAEYLEYNHVGKRAYVGAKLQPPIVADFEDIEEEGGLLAVSTISCFFNLSGPICYAMQISSDLILIRS